MTDEVIISFCLLYNTFFLLNLKVMLMKWFLTYKYTTKYFWKQENKTQSIFMVFVYYKTK